MISGHRNRRFDIGARIILLIVLFVLAVFVSMPDHKSFAFWTYNKPGDQPQRWLITSLIQWPKNDPLFDTYWRSMGKWSEFPDRGKDPIVGHGIPLFDRMDEKGRAQLSFNKAIEHYRKYLANPGNSRELEIAAQCLAHAYHYFEDIADFSDKNTKGSISKELGRMHQSLLGNASLYGQIRERGRYFNPDINSIIQELEKIKRRRDKNLVSDNIISIVACLNQVNASFLSQVSPSDLAGLWRRQDGHVVRFSGSGSDYKGNIVELTDQLKNCRFSVGEETFRVRRTGPATYDGQIKWRSAGGNAWWASVQIIVKGNTMTGGGNWVRVRK